MSSDEMTFDTSGFLYFGIAIPALAAGYWLYRRQLAFEANSRVTTGTVTEILRERVQHSNRVGGATVYYAPVVEFRADSGALITYHCTTYIAPNRYSIGMRLEVRYDPANPARAQLTNPLLVWLWPGVLAVVGVVFFVLWAVLGFRGGA